MAPRDRELILEMRLDFRTPLRVLYLVRGSSTEAAGARGRASEV